MSCSRLDSTAFPLTKGEKTNKVSDAITRTCCPPHSPPSWCDTFILWHQRAKEHGDTFASRQSAAWEEGGAQEIMLSSQSSSSSSVTSFLGGAARFSSSLFFSTSCGTSFTSSHAGERENTPWLRAACPITQGLAVPIPLHLRLIVPLGKRQHPHCLRWMGVDVGTLSSRCKAATYVDV